MFRTCIAIFIVTLSGSALLAAPVDYLESISGDLSQGGPWHAFTFDVGVNTISGSIGLTDADNFLFTVPDGMTITSASAELTDAQTGTGDIIYAEWDLDTGKIVGLGTRIQEFRVPSPGSVAISTPINPGTYNIDQASLRTSDFDITTTSDYTFSFTVIPEPASLCAVALAVPLLLGRRRSLAIRG